MPTFIEYEGRLQSIEDVLKAKAKASPKKVEAKKTTKK